MLPHSATAKNIWRSRSLMRLPIRPSQSMTLAIKDRLLGQKQNDHSIYITAAYGFNHTPWKGRPWTNRNIRYRHGTALSPQAALFRVRWASNIVEFWPQRTVPVLVQV